jgi:hypothetical protein
MTTCHPALRRVMLAARLMVRLLARLRVSNKIPFVWTDGRRIVLRMPCVKQSIRRPIFFSDDG